MKSVRKRKINIIWYHLYVESKIQHKWTHLWDRNRLTDIQNGLTVAKGERGERGVNWELGVSINRCKLLHSECVNNNDLLYNTGNCMRSPEINHNEKGYIKKKDVYMCITESLCCAAETTQNNTANPPQFSKRVNKAALQSYLSYSCVNSIFWKFNIHNNYTRNILSSFCRWENQIQRC